jgi:hypothetical protein
MWDFQIFTPVLLILLRVRASVTNNNGFRIGWLDLFALLLQSFLIAINYGSSESVTAYGSLHSLLDYECLLFHCDWLGSDLRITNEEWGLTYERTYSWTLESVTCPPFITRGEPNRDYHSWQFVYYFGVYPLLRNVCQSHNNVLISTSVFVAMDTRFVEPFSRNGLLRLSGVMSQYWYRF